MDKGRTYSQANNSDFHHTDPIDDAIDFSLPVGDLVIVLSEEAFVELSNDVLVVEGDCPVEFLIASNSGSTSVSRPRNHFKAFRAPFSSPIKQKKIFFV